MPLLALEQQLLSVLSEGKSEPYFKAQAGRSPRGHQKMVASKGYFRLQVDCTDT